MARELKCDIEEIYGFLNAEHSLVYCRVSWNNRKPKDEIRRCEEDRSGNLVLKKGIAITPDEISVLEGILNHTIKPDKGDHGKVNFEDLFRSGEGIMAKREAGYRTEDGFIVVSRKTPRRSNLI